MLCPNCDYDLTGLPAQHICPECGEAYDKTQKVMRFRPHLVRKEWRQVQLGIVVVAVILWSASRTGYEAADYWILGLLVSCAAWCGYRIWRKRNATTVVTLDEAGVTFEWTDQNPLTIEWASLDHAEVGWLFGGLDLVGRDDTQLLSIGTKVLGGRLAARTCAKKINQFSLTIRKTGGPGF